MTSLSQYMRAERVDISESASFYVPGALSWNDPKLRGLMGRRNDPTHDDVLFIAVHVEVTEPEEH